MPSAMMPPGWEAAELRDIGAPVTTANVELEDAWFDVEHGGPGSGHFGYTGGYDEGGLFNPFDTTLGSPEAGGGAPPGSTIYNSVGVMNYPSASVGLAENASVLEEPAYASFLAELRSGSLSLAELERAEDATPWGTAFTSPSNTAYPAPPTAGAPIQASDVRAVQKALGSKASSASLSGFDWTHVAFPGWAAMSGLANDAKSSLLGGVGRIVLEGLFIAGGLGLVIVGAYKAAGNEGGLKGALGSLAVAA